MRRAALIALVALVLGCSKSEGANEKEDASKTQVADASDEQHKDEPEHEELPKRVLLTPDVIADAKIKTSPVTKEVLAGTLPLTGEVAADPDKTAKVSAPAAGRIVQVKFKEGSEVKKGDVLALVRVADLAKIRSALRSATAKAAAARPNAERLQGLADKGLTSKQEAVSARAEAEALESEARGLAEQLNTLGVSGGASEIALRAPVAGIVVGRNAVVGQPVIGDETIATIADFSETWFLARVFEKDLGRVRVGAKAEVQLNAYADEHFEGTVEYLGRQIDPVARTLTARIRLVNRNDLLRLGLFGTARIATGEPQTKAPNFVVPRSAVTEIGGKTYVFVHHPDNHFEIHRVELGDAVLGKVEVVHGLRGGEQIVTEGVFTLKSAVLKSTIAEEE